MSEKRLIVGLGNPGRQYEYTRHNLGFLVCKKLGQKLKIQFELSSFTKGAVAQGKYSSADVCLLAPMTYMNNSGQAVRPMVFDYGYTIDNILVVTDDLHLPFGQLRFRPSGSPGGHNGLKSISERLETQDFSRLRMGIGQPNHQSDCVDYVLEEFTREEKKVLEKFVDEAAECCLVWIKNGNDKAMEQFNRRK